jgi:hypothetical protein
MCQGRHENVGMAHRHDADLVTHLCGSQRGTVQANLYITIRTGRENLPLYTGDRYIKMAWRD